MSGRDGRSPDGLSLAAVEILGLDDLVDGFTFADSLEGSQIVGALAVNLGAGQAADGDVGGTVTRDGILKETIFEIAYLTKYSN